MEMTASETRALEAAMTLDGPFTPTQLGMKMGYKEAQASSRVATALRSLRCMGKVERIEKDRRVHYRVV